VSTFPLSMHAIFTIYIPWAGYSKAGRLNPGLALSPFFTLRFFSRKQAKSECDWLVMCLVFVASQKSMLFFSVRAKLQLIFWPITEDFQHGRAYLWPGYQPYGIIETSLHRLTLLKMLILLPKLPSEMTWYSARLLPLHQPLKLPYFRF
jgi:hypothetical protein